MTKFIGGERSGKAAVGLDQIFVTNPFERTTSGANSAIMR